MFTYTQVIHLRISVCLSHPFYSLLSNLQYISFHRVERNISHSMKGEHISNKSKQVVLTQKESTKTKLTSFGGNRLLHKSRIANLLKNSRASFLKAQQSVYNEFRKLESSQPIIRTRLLLNGLSKF